MNPFYASNATSEQCSKTGTRFDNRCVCMFVWVCYFAPVYVKPRLASQSHNHNALKILSHICDSTTRLEKGKSTWYDCIIIVLHVLIHTPTHTHAVSHTTLFRRTILFTARMHRTHESMFFFSISIANSIKRRLKNPELLMALAMCFFASCHLLLRRRRHRRRLFPFVQRYDFSVYLKVNTFVE